MSLTPFHFYQFLPFYYLGDSQYKSGDFPNALRSFYLSSERSEPKRDEEDATEKLASHTVACEKWFQRAGVGERNQYFSEAHRLRKLRTSEDWQEAAERFWDALQIEPENGQTTNAAGRWPDPYLPRFWLAKTLARLECYQLACDQLDRSLLNRLSSERIKEERNQMAELQLVCAKSRNEPVRSEICQRWQCWLKRGGLQTP